MLSRNPRLPFALRLPKRTPAPRRSDRPNRRGMGILIAMMLLVVFGGISASTVKDFHLDRKERQDELMRAQAFLLADGCIDRAVRLRQADPGFAGECFVFGEEFHPLSGGNFRITTQPDESGNAFQAEIEYRDSMGESIYRYTRK